MALPATMRYNVTNGSLASDDNGGGFDTASGGTDYCYGASLPANDGPILSPIDLACVAASTTVTSVAGGFTDAMIGNALHITAGTNFTVGFYKITARTDTNTITVDRTPAPSLNGEEGVGCVGGALATLNVLESVAIAGNIILVKSGTYTQSDNFTPANSGTATSWISIIGYQTTLADCPTGTNRPLWNFGANGISAYARSYWSVENMRLTSTAASAFYLNAWWRNCSFENTSTTADRIALLTDASTRTIDCEFAARYGIGWAMTATPQFLTSRCYFRDSKVGLRVTEYRYPVLQDMIFDTCMSGVTYTGGGCTHTTVSCTFVNCQYGLKGTAAGHTVLSNLFYRCDYGLWLAASGSPAGDYNNFHSCTTATTNYTAGPNDTASDPLFESDIVYETAVTYTDASKLLTKAGMLTGVTLDGTEYVRIISGTGVTPGIYPVTKTDDDTLQLVDDIGSNAVDVVICLVAGADLRVGSASDCIGQGFPLRLGVAV